MASAQDLVSALQASHSNDKQARDQATEYLMSNSGTPGLAPMMMDLISDASSDLLLRTSAAANLYSLIQRNWNAEESPYPPIPDEDKAACKARVVGVMLEVPSQLFKSVSGALQVMVAHEFPERWPELMPMLVERLQSEDPNVVICILKTMNSVLKYYRNKPNNAGIVRDLLAVLDHFAGPLRRIAEGYTQEFDSYQGNDEVLSMLLTMMKLIWEIFLSLTSVDLPQVFLDDLQFWMDLLRKYLTYTSDSTVLLHGDDDMTSQPGPLTKVHSSVIRVLAQFVKKYDEEIEPYIQPLLEDVWNVLQRVGGMAPEVQLHFDTLVIESLTFLSTTITGVHHTMFKDVNLLMNIATNIIMPNIRFPPNAMDTFEYEALDYIRSDFEGSDSHTRRRSAVDLVKGIRRYYESDITNIFSDIIAKLLEDYQQDPENNWYLKDQAIYIVIALATKSQTQIKGVVAVNELVPLIEFFEGSILSELEDVQNLNARPVIKADCLRFAISFRRQLNPEHLARLIPLFSSYLTAESTVVASYAAIGIDAFLTMKDGNVSRVPQTLIESHMNTLFENLFARISNTTSKFESENPYMGTAIARLISTVGGAIVPLAKTCLDSLTSKLAAIYRNPSNATFIHSIFESIAAIIHALIKNNRPELCDETEQTLLPAFNAIFEEDILDLIPYVYQLMSQLIEARKADAAQLWERYGAQFSNLTTAQHWERFSNIPALTRLVSAYLRFAPTYVAESVVPLFGIFGRVNGLRTYEKYAFRLILDIFLNIDRNVWQADVPKIFDLMFGRLRDGTATQYQNHFIIFASNVCYAQTLGAEFLVEAINSVQANVFPIVLNDVIVRHMGRSPDFRTVVVGLTCLLTSAPMIESYSDKWVALLGGIVDLAVGNREVGNGNDDGLTDAITLVSQRAGTSDFAKLNFSGESDGVIVPRDIVPQTFLATRLGELSAAHPGTLPEMCASLSTEASNSLMEILQANGVTLS